MATLALAVASISFYAVPTLIDDAMQQEVRDGRVADLVLDVKPLELTPQQLQALEALPNVAALEARNAVDVRVLVGERRAPARVIGIRDFDRQSVDVVRVESGAFPARGEVLADVQNANTGCTASAPATWPRWCLRQGRRRRRRGASSSASAASAATSRAASSSRTSASPCSTRRPRRSRR